jgi:hypothetical protein
MLRGRTIVLGSAWLAAGLALCLPGSARAADARVLDSDGRVLTVGSFALTRVDGGGVMRSDDERILSWELHDQERLLAYGVVPGTEGLGTDSGPALSRNPVTGDSWLVWSRQVAPDMAREIMWLRFDGTPDASSLQSLSSGTGDQADPAIIHDEAGWAHVAWVDVAADRKIRGLGITPGGGMLAIVDLSEASSTDNSAPQLGIDAHGQLFAAFLGTDVVSGVPALYVLAPSSRGGGIQHVPNPLIELGLRATLPTPSLAAGAGGPAGAGLAIHLTVLGGTPVAWWTRVAGGNRTIFEYVAEGEEGWTSSAIQAIDLSTGLLGSVPDALALVEARLRRVISTGSSPAAPSIPGMPSGPGRPITIRR